MSVTREPPQAQPAARQIGRHQRPSRYSASMRVLSRVQRRFPTCQCSGRAPPRASPFSASPNCRSASTSDTNGRIDAPHPGTFEQIVVAANTIASQHTFLRSHLRPASPIWPPFRSSGFQCRSDKRTSFRHGPHYRPHRPRAPHRGDRSGVVLITTSGTSTSTTSSGVHAWATMMGGRPPQRTHSVPIVGYCAGTSSTSWPTSISKRPTRQVSDCGCPRSRW